VRLMKRTLAAIAVIAAFAVPVAPAVAAGHVTPHPGPTSY
jgi:hypothetical protein